MAEITPIPEPCVEDSDCIVCYTDGSSLFRDDRKAAGWGVYFGPDDPRNYGEPLGPGEQSNQRAELGALLQALTCIAYTQDILIWTDSMYAKNCVLVWYHRWQLRNWKKPTGQIRHNLDLIEPVVEILKKRKEHQAETKLKWVKGHSSNEGNEGADKLAGRGSRIAWLQRYGEPYQEPPPRPKRDIYNPPPPGFKFITKANGTEDIERIDKETLILVASRKKKKAEKRKANWDKMNAARQARPKNAEERVMAKKAKEEVAKMFPPPRISTSKASTTTPNLLQKKLAQQLINKKVAQLKATTTNFQQPVPEKANEDVVITGTRAQVRDPTTTSQKQVPESTDDDVIITRTRRVQFGEITVRYLTPAPQDDAVTMDEERGDGDATTQIKSTSAL